MLRQAAHQLCAVGGAELAENIGQVVFDGVFAHAGEHGYAGVGLAEAGPLQYFALAFGEGGKTKVSSRKSHRAV